MLVRQRTQCESATASSRSERSFGGLGNVDAVVEHGFSQALVQHVLVPPAGVIITSGTSGHPNAVTEQLQGICEHVLWIRQYRVWIHSDPMANISHALDEVYRCMRSRECRRRWMGSS